MHGRVARIQLGLLDAYEFYNWSTSNKDEGNTSSLLSSYRQWAAVTANRLPICGILLLHIIVTVCGRVNSLFVRSSLVWLSIIGTEGALKRPMITIPSIPSIPTHILHIALNEDNLSRTKIIKNALRIKMF